MCFFMCLIFLTSTSTLHGLLSSLYNPILIGKNSVHKSSNRFSLMSVSFVYLLLGRVCGAKRLREVVIINE